MNGSAICFAAAAAIIFYTVAILLWVIAAAQPGVTVDDRPHDAVLFFATALVAFNVYLGVAL